MIKLNTFEEHLNKYRGAKGTPERAKFEADSLAFRIGELLKEERRKAHMTQEELAKRTGTKKSYISRVELGKTDIQLSTFFRLIEIGLGRTVNLTIS